LTADAEEESYHEAHRLWYNERPWWAYERACNDKYIGKQKGAKHLLQRASAPLVTP